MKRILSLCLVLLLLGFNLVGCVSPFGSSRGETVEQLTRSSVEKQPVLITCGGKIYNPYLRWSWSQEMSSAGFVCADALSLSESLPKLLAENKLPTIRYADNFTVQYAQNVTFQTLRLFRRNEEEFNCFSVTEDWNKLSTLKNGEYIVSIGVHRKGDYIEQVKQYESFGYDCLFILIV